MATLEDTNRASFVQQAYRYVTAVDNSIIARNPTAREVEINTNLNQASAQALANAYLADNKQPRAYEVQIEGVIFLDTLADGVPRFILESPKSDGRTLKLVGFTTDYETNTTTLQVRG